MKLIAIGGLSGSGKSTVAKALQQQMPNTVILRSDVLRKQYFNVAETEKLQADAYTPEISAIIYQQMFDQAATLLKDHNVILDAVFLKAAERAQAANIHPDFSGFWLEIDDHLAKQRLSERQNDASDADMNIRHTQAMYQAAYLKNNHLDNWYIIQNQGQPMLASEKIMSRLY